MVAEGPSDGRNAKRDHRLILLAYYFPPLAGVASERAASLASRLRSLGWAPIVITPQRGFYHKVESEMPLGVPIKRTRSFEVSRVVRGVYGLGSNQQNHRTDGTIEPVHAEGWGMVARQMIRDFVYVPDAQVGWIPFACMATASTVRRLEKPPILFSSSVPYSTHVAAMVISQRYDLPWVAEFRDPWSTSGSPTVSTRKIRRALNWSIEDRIVTRADHVIVTDSSTQAALLSAHPSLPNERVSVIRNGFEPMPHGRPPRPDQPMVMLYAGNVWPGEDMEPILEALDAAHASDPGAFRLRILGPPQEWTKRPPSERPWLKLDGVVTPAEARQAMVDSSALLLVQQHHAYQSVLPGKAFEYIGARRPIVAVLPTESEAAEMIRNHSDARLVDPGQLAAQVGVLLEQHRSGKLQRPRVPESVTASLAREERARELSELLARLIQDRLPTSSES